MLLKESLWAHQYAQGLLNDLSLDPNLCPKFETEAPAQGWIRSGLMALTGNAAGPPLMCPVPITACAAGALAALQALTADGALDDLDAARLLAERAELTGLTRQGALSAGGSCRLLPTRDGHVALNLARDDDWSLLPAWLETEIPQDWAAVSHQIREQPLHDLVVRGRLLGLAIAPLLPPTSSAVPWCHSTVQQAQFDRHPRAPLVVDLSSLWAGPLCSRLLQRCGARVVKIESRQRPDGARHGPPAFFQRMNSEKESLALDFSSAEGIAELREWLLRADIVIEASRPRALRQLGIVVEDILRQHPRLTWVSLTGYGRGEPRENWIAYGDDAGVAAGLSWLMQQATGETVFVGDAIADPLTGLHAALAAWAGYHRGGAGLISLALIGVVGRCLQFHRPISLQMLRQRQRQWGELAS